MWYRSNLWNINQINHTKKMKFFSKFLIMASFVMAFAGCQEDPKELTPEIKMGQTTVSLSSNGDAVSVAYIVENAVEGEKIAVENSAEWLTINTNKVRAIEFSATENPSSEPRTTTVTVAYKGAESVTVEVTQACYDTPLRIEIHDVTAADLYFSVFTTDPELTWLPMVSSKAYFDAQQSDSALFDDNLEYYEYLASGREMSLEDYLTEMVAHGTVENILFEGLQPSTEYVVYAYGITPKGVRTTEVVWEAFTTEEPWSGDLTFEFNVMEEHHTLFFDVTPSHTGVPYYFTIVEKSDIEGWMEKYNTTDIREAIQKGDIDETYQILMDYEFIHDQSDFYALFNVAGRLFDEQMPCNGNTTYVLCAAKWNTECQLIGEVATFEYTSEPVPPSDNQLTLEVTNITRSSADAVVTASNNDPYVIIPVQSKAIEGMDDAALFEYLFSNYDYLLSEYTFVGNKTRNFGSLEPNTRYTFVTFGYLAGIQTTDYILRKEITTGRSDDPKDCTFEFEWTVDTEEAWVKITPSDDGHHYYWSVYDARYTSEEAKSYISDVIIDDWYEGSFSAFASWNLSQGMTSGTASDLNPDTEYKIGVVIMDIHTGEFLTDVIFSENFRTKAIEYANLKMDVYFGPYYDIQQLVEAGFTGYKYYAQYGDAILPATINVRGDYSEFYYTVYARDLTDVETYPDKIFIESLPQDGSYYNATLFPISYDDNDPNAGKMYTMCAIAFDRNGKYTKIYRKAFSCAQNKADAPTNFVDPTAVAPALVSAVKWLDYDRKLTVGRRAERSTPLNVEQSCEPSVEVDENLVELNEMARAKQLKERFVEASVEQCFVVPTK